MLVLYFIIYLSTNNISILFVEAGELVLVSVMLIFKIKMTCKVILILMAIFGKSS